MSKKTLYSNITPYLAGLISVTYLITLSVYIIPTFKDNPQLTFLFTGIVFLCLVLAVTYMLYRSINTPLDKVVNYLDNAGSEGLSNELKMEDTTIEYEKLIAKVNKMTYSLKANIDQRIKNTLELQKSHEELKKAYEELKELDRLKADFIANISHELRTPLISVEGYIEYINSGKFGKLNQKQKDGIEASIVGIKRLKKQINQLLMYSRLDAKQEIVEIDDINIEAISNEVIKEYEKDAKDKKIKLTINSEKNLPKVKADKQKIKHAILNLMDNAVKFTEKGEVKISLEKTEQGVKVSVIDTGVGIPQKYKEKLFDRFSQSDTSASRKFGGVGLGLTVVKGILDLHDININVESQEGKGSTFSFTLPTS